MMASETADGEKASSASGKQRSPLCSYLPVGRLENAGRRVRVVNRIFGIRSTGS